MSGSDMCFYMLESLSFVQSIRDTTDTNFDTNSPMVYVEICRVMQKLKFA